MPDDHVAARCGDPDAGLAAEWIEQTVDPAFGDDDVVVEQHDVLAGRRAKAVVVAPGVAAIGLVVDHANVRIVDRGEHLSRRLAGTIVHDDHFVRLRRMRWQFESSAFLV